MDLEPIKEQIRALVREGNDHVESWKDQTLTDGSMAHIDGPDPECAACDDIYGHAAMLRDLVAEIERLRGASAAREPWQPIEAAPKDGTAVVVRFRNDIHEPEVARFIDGHWRTSDTAALWPPHYWMPLPAPPATPEGSARSEPEERTL